MSTQYTGQVLTDGATTYLRADEPSGATAYDYSGNNNNGTYNGGITYQQASPIASDTGKSVLLNGTTAFIALPSGSKPDGLFNFSVEAWIFLPSATFAQNPRIAANDHTDQNNKGFQLMLNANGVDGMFNVGSGTSNANAALGVTFLASTWYHIVGTFDGNNIRTYVNGVLKNTTAFIGAIGAAGFNPAIGYNPNYVGDFFPGRIAEPALYNGITLSGAQITNHYNYGLAVLAASLYLIPINGKTHVIQADDLNQIINVLKAPAGGQELGHYVLEQSCYTTGATGSVYIPSISRNTTPVSVTLDASDLANVGFNSSPASTGLLKAAGFQAFALSSAASGNCRVGGKYTIQY